MKASQEKHFRHCDHASSKMEEDVENQDFPYLRGEKSLKCQKNCHNCKTKSILKHRE